MRRTVSLIAALGAPVIAAVTIASLQGAGASTLPVEGGIAEQHAFDFDCSDCEVLDDVITPEPEPPTDPPTEPPGDDEQDETGSDPAPEPPADVPLDPEPDPEPDPQPDPVVSDELAPAPSDTDETAASSE